MKCGDICWVNYPFSDGSSAKYRPVLIVSDVAFNGGGDVIVSPISASERHNPGRTVDINFKTNCWPTSGLTSPSVVKCTKVFNIAKSKLKPPVGYVDEDL